MGKLLQRLSDASRSGVYRVSRADEVLEATEGSRLHVSRISLSGVRDKPALLASVGRALRFPDWFGANWDALEDCLADLSWLEAPAHVLLLEDSTGIARDDLAMFIDILASVARDRAARGKPFFAVFIDGPLDLPPLMRERAPRS